MSSAFAQEKTTVVHPFLSSQDGHNAFRLLQRTGDIPKPLYENLPGEEKAYIIAELNVRRAVYNKSPEILPDSISPWMSRLVSCYGHLFTSPSSGLEDLEYLEAECTDPVISYRLRVWRMHLLLLLGFESEGIEIRDEIENVHFQNYPWEVESRTLFAISYFSTSQTKVSVQKHIECLKLIESEPEIFFQSLGASLAMRAAIKICDAEAFDFFSKKVEESLAVKKDDRYEMRSLSYRAIVLTQLGETSLSQKYWEEGDRLLAKIDNGQASVERCQYLTFRCLAAALLGDLETVNKYHAQACKELKELGEFPIHAAELEICRILAPLANPYLRGKNIARAFEAVNEAISFCQSRIPSSKYEAVRTAYMEAKSFCESLLSEGSNDHLDSSRDKWRTFPISIIDNHQNFASFAQRIDYFRLIPKFVTQLEQTSLTDEGIEQALKSVLHFSPTLSENGFAVNFERGNLSKVSQVNTLLNFANSLLFLSRKARENTEAVAIASTVQMIAHDVRRPFNLLRLSLGAIEAAKDVESIRNIAQKSVPKIEGATERVSSILKDILEISKPVTLNRQRINLKDLISSSLEVAGAQAIPGIILEKVFEHSFDIDVDAQRMERAFINLLENAAQAQPNGGKIWVLSRDLVDTNNPKVELRFGSKSFISSHDIDKIFQPFFTKGKSEGTGLGLAIVKKTVELHGGRIWCESSLQNGTEFFITLPAYD